MKRIKYILKKAFTNNAILYVLTRYGTYLIQFINSLFIAVYLGPYYLGIWGFLILVLDYLNQLNLGISNSVNVIISVNKENERYVEKVTGNGLSMILIMSLIVLFLFILNYLGVLNIGEKYNLNIYVIPISIIAIITHFNVYLMNIFRVYGKIFAIALSQSLYPIIVIFLIPFFKGEDLLWAMVTANLISVLIALFLFIAKNPLKFQFLFNIQIIKSIQKKGWYLFIFNSSIALLLISTKSFLSEDYSVREFGYFTFSYSLANAILLFLNSFAYLFFPKMLNRFANTNIIHIRNILNSVRTAYISTSHVLIHFLIMILPLILLIFPEYKQASNVFKVTALAMAAYTNAYGYQTLLIAKGKEKLCARIAFISLIFNIILVSLFVYVFNVRFDFVMFATMIVYLFYVFISGIFGRSELKLTFSIFDTIADLFHFKVFLPFAVSVVLLITSLPDIYFILPFILYILLNFKDIRKIKELISKLISNPDFINI